MNSEKYALIFASLIATIVIWGCSGNDQSKESAMIAEDMASVEAQYGEVHEATVRNVSSYISSSAATMPDDTARKFILTANLKFRVKNVIESTYNIEEIAVANGGFVASSRLNYRMENQFSVAISRDSILETTYYVPENRLELRVPAARLDTTLKAIAHNIEMLDYRDIQSADVTLDFLEYSLIRKREERAARRAAQSVGRKSNNEDENNKMTPEELIRDSEEKADNAMLNALRLSDRVSLATITVFFFQRPIQIDETLPADRRATDYRPGLLSKISASFSNGWLMIESVLLFIVGVWPAIIVVVCGVVGWRIARKKRC